jgi:hypothetical protein
MALGSGLSWSGIGIELLEDIVDNDGQFDFAKHAVNIGTEYLPDLYGNNFSKGAIELDNLMIELGASGSDAWIDLMSDIHNK